MKLKKFELLLLILAGIFVIYILISLFSLFGAIGWGSDILEQLSSNRVLLALWISVATSTIVALIALIFGIPTAWLLAYRDFRGKTVLETLIVTIPISYPPGVVGMSYLLVFGQTSLVNSFWAIIMVKTFISSPFLISLLTSKFREIRKTNLEVVAKSLGASDFQAFRTISLPLSIKTIAIGSGLTWARAMGEIAGTIVFAGAIIPGWTETIPSIIVFEAQTSLPIALTVAMILALFSITILIIFRVLIERKADY
ncbi:MAG: ABC transporter permease [Candidatus Helarchaeota archaeon]|nr:ABC transporter permease [Candidatus Helarchaeota archaeon]